MLNTRNIWILIKDKKKYQQYVPILLTEKRKQKPKKLKIGTLITENKEMLNTRNISILLKDRKKQQQNIPTLFTEKRKEKPNKFKIGTLFTENKKEMPNKDR